jgi:hypothetical protein
MSTSLSLPSSSTSVHRVVWAAALTIAGLASSNAADSQNGPIQKNITTASTTVATIMHWWSWVAHVSRSPRPPTSSHVTRTTIDSIPIGFRDDSWVLQEVENPIPIFHFTQWSDETLTVDMTDFLDLATLATNRNTIALKKIKQEKFITFIEKYTKWFPIDRGWKRNIFMYCATYCARALNEVLWSQKINWLNLMTHQGYPKMVRNNHYAAIGKNTLIISPVDLWPEPEIEELKQSYWKDNNWKLAILTWLVWVLIWTIGWIGSLEFFRNRRRKKEEKEHNNKELEDNRTIRLAKEEIQKWESASIIMLGITRDEELGPSTTYNELPQEKTASNVMELLRWNLCQYIVRTHDNKDIIIEYLHRELLRYIKITLDWKILKKDVDNTTYHEVTYDGLDYYLKFWNNPSKHEKIPD